MGTSSGRGAGGQAEAVRVGCHPSLATMSSLEMGTVSLHILKSGVTVPFSRASLLQRGQQSARESLWKRRHL